jgi:4,5-dihydroxyphthalate decarboxylase
MVEVALTLGCIDYFDRTRPIIAGQVTVPGVDVTCVPLAPLDLAARWAEFDVTEIIVPVYMQEHARGNSRFIAIPVFPYRAFFLGNVIANVAAGIERPEDLNGKRVGTPGFHLAGTLWLRGILAEHFGVQDESIHWFASGQPQIQVPPTMSVEIIPPDRTLSDMLDRGEIDAWIGSLRPDCFNRGSPNVRRLLPNYRQAEEEYARRTGVFPILHTVAVRRELYEQHRWIAASLFELFQRARQEGLAQLAPHGVPSCGLPWLAYELEELPKIFGGDWYRYGFQANHAVLATMARYAAQQGLTPAAVDVASLFAEETLD